MSYHRENEQLQKQLTDRNRIIAGLIVVVSIMAIAVVVSRQSIRVDLIPGLSSPTSTTAGTMPKINVYAFAERLTQNLNYWEINGAKDYQAQQDSYQSYITPRARQWLKRDLDNKLDLGEIRGRTRELDPIPGVLFENKRVIGKDGSWIVWLDFKLTETLKGVDVKNDYYRFGVKVVASKANSANQWGLRFDGYTQGSPVILSQSEKEKMGLET